MKEYCHLLYMKQKFNTTLKIKKNNSLEAYENERKFDDTLNR